ncbi:hypothetical protein Cni_G18188 [Canna indica]|uniref:Uncharacterized protein n=1 Tax=Canna indica TaxID=4628 RepID=A0AAQ3QIH0_9LILI|nr:hypothetical protein Cni_G18188 [Canna indica]
MSEEEQKIRAELEMEIERGLEEELKDGICHLSLNLHRLYLHRKKKKPLLNMTMDQDENEVTTVVKITTRTVGGCMMQIYESKTNIVSPPNCSTSTRRETAGRSAANNATGGSKQGERRSCSNTSTQQARKLNERYKTKQLELGWKY